MCGPSVVYLPCQEHFVPSLAQKEGRKDTRGTPCAMGTARCRNTHTHTHTSSLVKEFRSIAAVYNCPSGCWLFFSMSPTTTNVFPSSSTETSADSGASCSLSGGGTFPAQRRHRRVGGTSTRRCSVFPLWRQCDTATDCFVFAP